MGAKTRTEYVLGLIVPILVLAALVALGITGAMSSAVVTGPCEGADCPTVYAAAVPIAFMAAVPMFSAMFARALFSGIVAVLTIIAAAVTAANGYGKDFYDALPVLIGVIIATGAAVLASQARAATAPRPRPAPAAASGAVAAVTEAGEPLVDDLTGLPTRAGALPALRASTETAPRVVAVIDVDHLAALNETHGRPIGDTFLFAVAGRTRYALPDEDLVARWDGEEFVVVAHGDTRSTRELLELITDKVNKNPIRTDVGLLPQAMSVGAADWAPGVAFDDALAQARSALYRAKAQGGAQLVIAEASA